MLPQEYALMQDAQTQRCVLHFAIINKERELIEYIVQRVDGDKGEMRACKDYKGKRPQEYDQAN